MGNVTAAPNDQVAFDRSAFDTARLVFCERFTEQSNIWNLVRHRHRYVEFLYFLEGGARVHGDKDDLTVSVFDLVVYPENTPHLEIVDLSQHQEVICLGIQFPGPSGLRSIRRFSDLDGRLRWPFVELHLRAKSDSARLSSVANHLLQIVLAYVKEALDEAVDNRDPVGRVIHYMHENLPQKMTIRDLASLANCSASYLDRLFKQRTGSTPMQYLERIRLAAASRLLLRRDLDVSQVAGLIGFSDPRYFSRRFAARFGAPPSRYRAGT